MEGAIIPAGAADLLVTLDQNYLPQLRVMLLSLRANNPGLGCRVFLLHRSIPEEEIAALSEDLTRIDISLQPVCIDPKLFEGAPVTKQYPQEMYYRLLAARFLPQSLERVLYLDPDLLIINPIAALWQMEMQGALFAAAPHTGMTELANNVNRIRLGTQCKYYNSGVLLIDLAQARGEIQPEEVFDYVDAHRSGLLLPDQDVLNAMYGERIFPLDDFLWNYDARNFTNYYMRSSGMADSDWVMRNTAILHFCGKAKPWKPFYRYRFGMLYRHYMQLAERTFGEKHMLWRLPEADTGDP